MKILLVSFLEGAIEAEADAHLRWGKMVYITDIMQHIETAEISTQEIPMRCFLLHLVTW